MYLYSTVQYDVRRTSTRTRTRTQRTGISDFSVTCTSTVHSTRTTRTSTTRRVLRVRVRVRVLVVSYRTFWEILLMMLLPLLDVSLAGFVVLMMALMLMMLMGCLNELMGRLVCSRIFRQQQPLGPHLPRLASEPGRSVCMHAPSHWSHRISAKEHWRDSSTRQVRCPITTGELFQCLTWPIHAADPHNAAFIHIKFDASASSRLRLTVY